MPRWGWDGSSIARTAGSIFVGRVGSKIRIVAAYKKNRWLLDHLKNVPCTDCGRRFVPWAMDFDHVRGEKLANVGSLVHGPTEVLLAEVAKCEVVCSNCHRARELNRYLDAWDDAALDQELALELARDRTE